MLNFLLSVVASLLAGILFATGIALVSRRARWALTATVARWLGVDVEYVFTKKDQAQADLREELERANDVRILAGRGNELSRETFSPLFLHRQGDRRPRIRILLPTTDDSAGEYDWTAQRDRELGAFDPAFGQGLLRLQINVTVEFLRQHVAAGNVELRRYNTPHIGRLIATERYLYYAPYTATVHGRDNRVYKYRRGEMYDNLTRLFEQLWNSAGI